MNGRTQDASSSSTTALSSPVDWLEIGRVPPGAVGITNHLNTCFINAVVQCLSNTPAFVVHALDPAAVRPHHVSSSSQNGQHPARSEDGELGRELSRLLRSMWSGRCSSNSSSAFHGTVRRLASAWYRGQEQNDANEFAAWLLNRLRDEGFGVDSCQARYPAVKPTVRLTITTGGVVH